MFDDEHDTKNYLINKRSVKLVLIRIVKIKILKYLLITKNNYLISIYIFYNSKEKIIVIGHMTVIYLF